MKNFNNEGKKLSNIDQRLLELGIVLPKNTPPLAVYVPSQIFEKLIFTSGQLCMKEDKLLYEGKLGEDLSLE